MNHNLVNPKESLSVALFLAMNTGFVDAFTFFHFNGRFASLQTGNLIQTGIYLSQSNLGMVTQYMIPVLFFVFGAGFKTLMTKKQKKSNKDEVHFLLIFQMVGIALFTLLFSTILKLPDALFVGILSFFMVIQGDIFTRVNGLPYANIMSTGNIKSFGTNLAEFFIEKDIKRLKNTLLFFKLILAFIIGAFLSSFLSHYLKTLTLLGASVLLLIAYILYLFELKKGDNSGASI